MTRQFAVALLIASGVPAVLAPAEAVAEIYLSFGAGGSRVEASPAELGMLPQGFDPPAVNQTPESIAADQAAVTDFGASDLAVQFMVGWRARFVGVEVGYVNFNQMGRSESTEFYVLPQICQVGGCQDREWLISWSGDGYQASLLGYLPVGKSIELYGKVGAIAWEADVTGRERTREIVPPIPQIPAGNDSLSGSDDGTDLTFGLGAALKTGTPFSVRIQADYYDLDNTDGVMMYTVNAVYSFGQSD
jgi:hypothetical protein